MTRRRIQNVLWKEWELLFTDVNTALMVTLLPLLIVGQGVLYIWLAVTFGGEAILGNPMFQSTLEKLRQALPGMANLPQEQQSQLLLLNQFNFFLLLIPTMIAMSVATFSIVDEKLSGSLEALLATPVRTWELLLGKALAGAIPALVMTWLSAGVFLLAMIGLGWGNLIAYVVTPAWFLSIFLLTPGVALLSFMLGVVASSRAKDARSAQTISLLIILPVLAVIVLQVIGLIWFTPLLILALALGLVVGDFVVLRIAVRLFQRESILVRWR
ncbi:MAG: type transporter [Dehalococcoidales bacterium]|nr:type transporter [Dehalococcoidales bacterium]